MVVKEKARLMSRVSIFENSKEGKEALSTIRFFRNDFVRWEILKTVVSVSLGYAILLSLLILYHLEYIIKNATKLNYRGLGFRALGIYLVVIIIYVAYTFMRAVYKFRLCKKRFVRYEHRLKELAKMYDLEENIREDSHDTASSDQG